MDTSGTTPKLREVIAAVPAECYDKPTWLGLLYTGRSLLLHGALCLMLVAADHPLWLVVLWPLGGLTIGGMFVLGHDAAHGALFRQRWLNELFARLLLLPSLHAGAGFYYAHSIWWEKMMRLHPPERFVAAFCRDRALVCTYAALWSQTLFTLGYTRESSVTAGLWMWLKVGLLPWLFWNHFIGATVHIHHAAPDILWRRHDRWTRYRGQVEAMTSFTVPWWYNLFAHNIHLHAAHHVDPRIPFYHLPRATTALQAHFGAAFALKALRLRDHVATVRRCKVYDFENQAWLTYAEAQASSPKSSITPQSAA